MARVTVGPDDFDIGREIEALRAGDAAVGAVASFIGTVRGADVDALELEHYPGMTEAAIEAMIDAAVIRFDLRGARVIHRVGRLSRGEQIVLVAVTAPHRRAAFDGCAFLMDWLKTQAPFWKKEHGPAGARWVDARASDDAALARWDTAARHA